MPVSRVTAEGLAQAVADAFATAEVRLLRLIAKHLEAGHDSPDWLAAKLAELQTFRARARRIAAEARTEALGAMGESVVTAYLWGTAAGQGDADALGVEIDAAPTHAERAVAALVRAQHGMLQDAELRIVRAATDAYRTAVVRAATGTLTGATTRLQDAQTALDELARRGIGEYVDARGRRTSLVSYVEMATRTTTAQAAITASMDRLEQGGINLFLVSNSSRECPTCRPWEGKVLSRGPVAALHRNALTGAMEAVRVDGTVDEAMRAGLFHANCTHGLSGFIPGATRRGDATSNARGYEDKQRLRAMERNVREWKRREAVAITPEAKRKAAGKVRAWQAEIAAHTKATGLPRKRNRESLTAAR